MPISEDDFARMKLEYASVHEKKIAVVLDGKLNLGLATNAAAIAVAGLRSNAFGSAIQDGANRRHAKICCNLVVLRAKTQGSLHRLADAGRAGVESVLFTSAGFRFNNDPEGYEGWVSDLTSDDVEIAAVAICGDEETVTALTKRFSVFPGKGGM